MSTSSSDVVAGTNATSAQYNNLRADHNLGKNLSNTETDGATVTIDWSSTTKGKVRRVTIAGNRVIAFSNAVADQVLIVQVIQDGTGGRTVTWPGGVSWPFGVTPALTSTASKKDTFAFIATSSTTFEGATVGLSYT